MGGFFVDRIGKAGMKKRGASSLTKSGGCAASLSEPLSYFSVNFTQGNKVLSSQHCY